MAKSLYLINPRSETPSYFGAEVFEHWGFEAAQGNADLAICTVAAMAPDDWDISLCDEHMEEVDYDRQVDFVGITGKVTQRARMLAIAEKFRARGITVIMGGPYVSLSPSDLRPHCDVLVVGEMESIADDFFADLDSGDWKSEYTGDRPDLLTSPLPRWDLYNNDRSLLGCVQTSRGCPFDCEFCDVIQYLGRNQRHKSIEQVLAELDQLYDLGYRAVFLADDNLTAYRKRAKELLAAIGDWNLAQTDGAVRLVTQLSIDAARDKELMDLLARSGMTWVFVGIETPNVESLRETGKRQNIGIDLIEQVEVFLEYGIGVMGGMIVGFDHDDTSIFQVQHEFAMRSPIPFFTLGALVAPQSTPLYDRMEEAGRLVHNQDTATTPWDTNIVPELMNRTQLDEGLQWLCNSLYTTEAFAKRMLRMIECLGPPRGPFALDRPSPPPRDPRPVEEEAVNLLKKFVRQGKEERRLFTKIFEAMAAKPGSEALTMMTLFRYAQVRALYEHGKYWEPQVQDVSPFAGVAIGSSEPVEKLVTIGS